MRENLTGLGCERRVGSWQRAPVAAAAELAADQHPWLRRQQRLRCHKLHGRLQARADGPEAVEHARSRGGLAAAQPRGIGGGAARRIGGGGRSGSVCGTRIARRAEVERLSRHSVSTHENVLGYHLEAAEFNAQIACISHQLR